jgi:hypothetical protein
MHFIFRLIFTMREIKECRALKSNFGLGLVDRIVLTASAAGAALCAVALFFPELLHGPTGAGEGEARTELGRFVDSESDVRRRLQSSLLWQDVRGTEVVFEGDSIFTGDDATAELKMADGVTLAVAPNSLVVLNRRRQGLAVDLQVGQIVAQSTRGEGRVTVVQDGREAELQVAPQATVQLERRAAGRDLGLRALSGAVTVQTQDDQGARRSERVAGDQGVRLDPALRARQPDEEIVLQSPQHLTNYWRPAGEGLEFRWRAASAEVRLEISERADLSQPLVDERVVGSDKNIVSLPAGRSFFWRVSGKGADGKELVSSVARFRLSAAEGPRLLLPKAGERLRTREDASIDFAWQARPGRRAYLWQLSQTADFANIIESRETKATRWPSRPPAPGTYYWRVGLVTRAEQTFWSEARVVHFEDATPPVPRAEVTNPAPPAAQSEAPTAPAASPVVSSAAVEESLTGISTPSEPEFAAAGDAIAQPLSSPYERPFGPEPLGAADNVDPIAQSSALPLMEPYGRPFGPEPPVIKGQARMSTDVAPVGRQFGAVVLDFPTDFFSREPADISSRILNPPILRWSAIANAVGYDVQVARDVLFAKELVEALATGSEWEFRPRETGFHHWRVRARGARNETTPWSAPVRFEVLLEPARLPAQLAHKVKVKTIPELATPGPRVDVQWPAVPLAAAYRIQVARAPSFAPSTSTDVTEPRASLDLATGKNYVRVVNLDATGRQVSAASNSLEIDFTKILDVPSPRVKYPADGLTIVNFEGQQNPIVFAWSAAPEVKAFDIQFSRTATFDTVIFERRIADRTFVLEGKIPKGRLFWRLRGLNQSHPSDWTPGRSVINN